MNKAKISFDDTTIQRLFGHEAAEDENPDRLRDYYFKGSVYQRAVADLPLRILVGHKGIGKSALFQVARQEDIEAKLVTVFLRPDDVHEIETNSDLLTSIRNWKAGLLRIIYEKAVRNLGAQSDNQVIQQAGNGLGIIDALSKAFRPLLEKAVDVEAAKREAAECFLQKGKIRVYIDDLDLEQASPNEGKLQKHENLQLFPVFLD